MQATKETAAWGPGGGSSPASISTAVTAPAECDTSTMESLLTLFIAWMASWGIWGRGKGWGPPDRDERRLWTSFTRDAVTMAKLSLSH